MNAPLEVVDAAPAHRAAVVETVVTAAWASHHEEVFAFLVCTTHDPNVAEDLLQEAFLRLTREVRADRTPDNIRAWLYRVAGNLAVSRGRRISSALRGLLRLGTPTTPPRAENLPETGYLHREACAELLAALDGIGPDARAALLLSSEGFSGVEIAAAIGRSEAATRTLLCRTRIKVRRYFESAEAFR